MKTPLFAVSLLALSMTLVTVSHASEMQDRFREEGGGLDLTGFFNAETDARSRSFHFGGVNEHDFNVTRSGIYRFDSRTTAGYSDNYQIAAVLEDDKGNVITRTEALGQNGGLAMQQRLDPGRYVLRVEAQRFGRRGKAGDGYSVLVNALNEKGQAVDDGVDDGSGIVFSGKTRESDDSVFVRSENAVVSLGNRRQGNSEQSEKKAANASVVASSAAETQQPGSAEVKERAASSQRDKRATDTSETPAFNTLVTDVKIRTHGEVLTFDMAESSNVAITTSTYPSGYEDTYRIELDVLNAQGRVVAEGAGEGFDGDVDLRTQLQPGRYTIRVNGQKFGNARDGVNNYELKVQ
ncbi:hypothetical protein [Halomonas llamarensis]|uniref:ABC transporter substrate-binding protein n=1 Tax=Halomonas llamarensis TaxID=2945104 RepID=A0ABT0SPS5_9GAMM|nr:hypothetical protein [Halomonas llamarensis]MCL7929752.1 hypothetical protein [Halomonas llamarensis]